MFSIVRSFNTCLASFKAFERAECCAAFGGRSGIVAARSCEEFSIPAVALRRCVPCPSSAFAVVRGVCGVLRKRKLLVVTLCAPQIALMTSLSKEFPLRKKDAKLSDSALLRKWLGKL